LFEEFPLKRIDGETRLYETPSGKMYPSVTSVLSKINKQGILEWRARVGEEEANKISALASSRGTRVHKMLEKYILNDDSYLEKAMPLNMEMFNQIKEYLDSYVTKVYGSELQMYSDDLKLAGTSDLLCHMHDERAVVDFKTSTNSKKREWIDNYFLQSAAYCIMAEERYNLSFNQFCILIATEHEGLQFFWEHAEPYKKKLRDFLKSIGHY